MIDIYNFGKYVEGLTNNEIRHYLFLRYKEKNNKKLSGTKKMYLFKRFCKIAGANTVTGKFINGKLISLMYRHDVERFADVMFKNKLTYFD